MISWYIDSSCISASTSHRSEELLRGPNSVGECVDVVVAGVHVERGAGGRRDAVATHHRPGAVVSHPDGDAPVVEHLADVVRVDVLDGEGDRSPTRDRVRRADHRDTGDPGEPLQRVAGDRLLVRLDLVHAEGLEVLDGGGEADD